MSKPPTTRPPLVTMEDLDDLEILFRVTIPEDYLDQLRHMNVQRYFAMYGDGARTLLSSLGITAEYIRERHSGNFVLKQFISYLQEVRLGEDVTIRARVLGRSEKRMHLIYFIVNETRQLISSTCEVLTSHADLNERRSSPFPPDIAANIDELLARHDALPWEIALSNSMGV